jgi:hypothetical protein
MQESKKDSDTTGKRRDQVIWKNKEEKTASRNRNFFRKNKLLDDEVL